MVLSVRGSRYRDEHVNSIPSKWHSASRALGVLSAALMVACGAKTDLESKRHEALDLLPDCTEEGARRPCESICGSGTEECVDGEWMFCDAPRPRPPELQAIVRDFTDDHPDFERPRGSSGLDLGIVAFELGLDDKPVYAGSPSTRTTTGRTYFDMWFRDVPENQRLSMVIELTPSRDDPEIFVYNDSTFFPIDGQGFGNQGRGHNFHFTLEVQTGFRYVGGETFTFSGDDDLWVFINRRLAIDIGGLHTQLTRSVDLDEMSDTLEIEIGEVYPLHLFFAERRTVASNFNIATTIAEFEFCD